MPREDVRQQIETMVSRHLLGPGDVRERLNARPSDIYLTGILWPQDSAIDAAEDDGGVTESADDDTSSLDFSVPGYRAVRPCSIGITFETALSSAVSISLGSTARYRPISRGTESEGSDLAADNGNPDVESHLARFEWQREPLDYRVLISAAESRSRWRTHEFIDANNSLCVDTRLAIDIRRRKLADRIVFTVTLINSADEAPAQTRDESLLFQAEICATAVTNDGLPAVCPRDRYPFGDDEDHQVNQLLYRDAREYAAGHGVSASWPAAAAGHVAEVRTSWMPRAIVFGTNPLGHQTLRPMHERRPSPFAAATLSELGRRQVTCADLLELCDIYESWIGVLRDRLQTVVDALQAPASRNLALCQQALSRMRNGIHTLESDDVAWRAFTLANRAMDMQAQFPSKGSQRRALVWRPFQLAFMLLVIPGLTDPSNPQNCRETMDLLWFPTGGGKTEAYLALSAFEIFRRRLDERQRRDNGGTDVLMRYTLRLLTIQQFQRAAALIAACELLRRRETESLGNAPISLGLYVGQDSTPNRLADAVERLNEERDGRKPSSTPRQLLECPACKANLSPTSYHIDINRQRMHVACSVTTCVLHMVPLSILTVDEAIYASPPSLLIATADKFAQLPRNASIRRLFGQAGNRLGLIIQDELHLISGPLGSMSGLYEAAIDLLCTEGTIRPKIIGSTATIGRAATQVRALFDREVLQFPPSGFDAADSFFAVRDDSGPNRSYLGISTAGRSPKFALQALLASLLQAVHALRLRGEFSDGDLDAYWTCVSYFNSLRELGGAHVLLQDDVRRQVAFLAARARLSPRPLEEPPEELSSRVASRDIPQLLLRLATSIGDEDPYSVSPPDAVLASNMISVGVDVPRLGLMAVNGQPKSTAEYIQATSRVGRGLPGLVVTLYNFGRPRDLSHFEHFQNYHQALYSSVEATSVTPWAPRARDKALHAVFAAAVRHLVEGLEEDGSAISFDSSNARVREIGDYLVRRARSATSNATDAHIRAEIDEIAADWERRASDARAANRKFNYWEKSAPFGKTAPHLLRSAEQLSSNTSAWATPNSLREVEPSAAFVLKRGR